MKERRGYILRWKEAEKERERLGEDDLMDGWLVDERR
jgi:hypothetical protein